MNNFHLRLTQILLGGLRRERREKRHLAPWGAGSFALAGNCGICSQAWWQWHRNFSAAGNKDRHSESPVLSYPGESNILDRTDQFNVLRLSGRHLGTVWWHRGTETSQDGQPRTRRSHLHQQGGRSEVTMLCITNSYSSCTLGPWRSTTTDS